LIGLNRLWRLPWRRRLAALSATLGSDLPFFFHGPAAWVTGRGEQVTRLSPPKQPWVVLVDPQESVSTKWAYASMARLGWQTKPIGDTPRRVGALSTHRLIQLGRNDMEEVTLPAFPVLAQIKHDLCNLGSNGVLMSGSGSVVFGLFDDREHARLAASFFGEKRRMRAWAVRVLRRSPF
jgi:4-diphosphocytidyl-2-C-methyl-D-erythritol kinase